MDSQLTILDEIAARLANITVTNGYRFTIVSTAIKRAQLTPFTQGDLPAINYWPVSDVKEINAGGARIKEFNVLIEIYDVTRDEPFTDIGIKRGNDVATALFRATSAPMVSDPVSPALGGLVTEIDINSLVPVIGEGKSPWCGALLDITIKYNTKLGEFSTIFNY